MKKIFSTIIVALLSTMVMAQTPEAVKYQAVARDATGNVYENQTVSFQISVLQGSATGTAVYIETHLDTTNAFGLVNLTIGQGSVVSGDFSLIDWSTDSYFLQVEMDPNGGSSYTIAGVSQLLSVPYALSAKTAEDDLDKDASNELQAISKTGNMINLSDGGGSVVDEVNDADADSTNEIQTLTISNDTLYLTDGGFAVLPAAPVNNDNDSTNEIQMLSMSNDTVYLTDGGFVVLPENLDNDTTNELQMVSISNDTVFLTDGGFAVLPAAPVNNDNDSTNEIQMLSMSNDTVFLTDGGFVVLPENMDNDSTNELQMVSISNDTVYLSDGGFAVLPAAPVNNDNDSTNEIQMLSISNDTVYLTDGGFAVLPASPINNDNDSTNEIQVLSISNDTIYLTDGGFVVLPVTSNNDNDSTNELQTLSFSNDSIFLTDGGDVSLMSYKNYWTKTGNDLSYSNGFVGINASPSNARFQTADTLTTTRGTSHQHIFNGGTYSGGFAYGQYITLTGTTAQRNRGVYVNTNGSATTSNQGGYFSAAGNSELFGLIGVSDNTTSKAPASVGVYGRGNRSSAENYGVYGAIGANGGQYNYGVYGETENNAGTGNYNTGVIGYAFGAGAGENYGVEAYAYSSTSANYAIYSNAAGTGAYAAYLDGNVTITGDLNVTGNLSKGGGTFKIDHPLDPENKYLVHSFVESPDMMNVYNGNVTTDADGYATVELPDYFEAANKDFRYQLTVIGTFAQAIVKEKVSGNKFVIQTNQPNVEVSWQVTGIRNDNYSNEYRIAVEPEKASEDKGKYLHPEAYELPSERGENYDEGRAKKLEKLKAKKSGMNPDGTERK